jgi:hypothetical protein
MRRYAAALAVTVVALYCVPAAQAAPTAQRRFEHASIHLTSPGRDLVKLHLVTHPLLANAKVRVHVVSKFGRRLLGRRRTNDDGVLTTTFQMPGPRKYLFQISILGNSTVRGERTEPEPLIVKN